MSRPRIDLDEEGWMRFGLTAVAVAALAVCAGLLGAPLPLIALVVAVLAGAPACWLWVRHFNVDNIIATRDARATDVPHHADEPHQQLGVAVDRPA